MEHNRDDTLPDHIVPNNPWIKFGMVERNPVDHAAYSGSLGCNFLVETLSKQSQRGNNCLSAIYNLCSYLLLEEYRYHFYVLISLAGIACIAYLILLWRNYDFDQPKARIKKRIWHSLVSVRNITVTCLAVIPIILGFSLLFRGGYVSAKTTPAFSGDENKLANNIETVSKLDSEIWPSLSTKEKLEVLQTVANVEARFLGLPHELNVRLGALPEDNLASYDDSNYIVTINIDHIEFSPPEEILNSVCHECYHAHQRRACDAYDTIPDEYKELLEFYDIQVYEREFSNYVSGADRGEEYYNQLVERHARAYGDTSVEDYYAHINEYLGKTPVETDEEQNQP